MLIQLPKTAKKFFWDVDFNSLNPNKYKTFVIERLLENGDEKASQWLLKRFSRQSIIKVLKQSRRLSAKSRNFWMTKLSDYGSISGS